MPAIPLQVQPRPGEPSQGFPRAHTMQLSEEGGASVSPTVNGGFAWTPFGSAWDARHQAPQCRRSGRVVPSTRSSDRSSNWEQMTVSRTKVARRSISFPFSGTSRSKWCPRCCTSCSVQEAPRAHCARMPAVIEREPRSVFCPVPRPLDIQARPSRAATASRDLGEFSASCCSARSEFCDIDRVVRAQHTAHGAPHAYTST